MAVMACRRENRRCGAPQEPAAVLAYVGLLRVVDLILVFLGLDRTAPEGFERAADEAEPRLLEPRRLAGQQPPLVEVHFMRALLQFLPIDIQPLDGLAVVDPLDEVLQRRPEVRHQFPRVVSRQAQVARASIAKKRRCLRRPAAPAQRLHGPLRRPELDPSEQLPACRRGAVELSPLLRQRLDPLIFLAYFLDGRREEPVHPDLRRVGSVGPAPVRKSTSESGAR